VAGRKLTAPHPLIWRSELDALKVGGFTVHMML
jgi:hypothetical protein